MGRCLKTTGAVRGLRFAAFCVLIAGSLGFEWPGRASRLKAELSTADAERRREVVRLLADYPAEEIEGAILDALEDEDVGVRIEAAETAGRVRLRKALSVLLDWLEGPDAEARKAAARAFGRMAEPRALPALVRMLGDSDAKVRHSAVHALAGLAAAGGPEAKQVVVPLLGRLDDQDVEVRTAAVKELGRLGDPRAVVPLVRCSQDHAMEVRVAAFVALGKLGDARALQALLHGLDDEVEEARLAAVMALAQLAEEGAVVGALRDKLPSAEPRIKDAILTALGAIQGELARNLLIDHLGDSQAGPAAADALVQRVRSASAEASSEAKVEASSEAGDAAVAGPGAEAAEVVAALIRALGRVEEPSGVSAIVQALVRVSQWACIRDAAPALLGILADTEGWVPDGLMEALSATRSPEVVMPLLEMLDQKRADKLDAVLEALLAYFQHVEADGRAADPLLAALQWAGKEERLKIIRLLGLVGASRALPTLQALAQQSDPKVQLAAARAMGAIADPKAGFGLLRLLRASDARVRFEAARGLSGSASPDIVDELLQRLLAPEPTDRHAVVIALGGVLAQLRDERVLPPSHAKKALRALGATALGEDEELAAQAVDALASWGDPTAAPVVARLLTRPSSRQRVDALMALGSFDVPSVRNLLRLRLRRAGAEILAAVAVSVGELGDARDGPRLFKVAKRRGWPVPVAAAYALARLARRGDLKKRPMLDKLCELGGSREPYVRANVAIAMAAMDAPPCPQGPTPLAWLDSQHSPAVRAAAARWAHAAAAAGELSADDVRKALVDCATRDPDRTVAEACRMPELGSLDDEVDVYAYARDGHTLLRYKLVALRLADGTVFVGYTDINGHLRVKRAPPGRIVLEDPGLVPLEEE